MRNLSIAVLLVVFSYIPTSSAGQFSADAFIAECLSDSINAEQKQKCRGFFYGLISKKQNLLTRDETDGVVDRAMNNRTPTASYAAVAKRTLGVDEICVPSDLSYDDFKKEFDQYKEHTKKDILTVESITAALAKAYSC